MEVRYVSCTDVADMTGVKLRTVWRWCNSGKLKCRRPSGREYLIDKDDLDAFLQTETAALAILRANKVRTQNTE